MGTHFVVLKLMKVINKEQNILIIQETLYSFVKNQPNQILEHSKIGLIMYSLLKCMAYLHSKRMVVRDLSPQHILMNEVGHPHLLHLGVMRSLQGTVESEEPEDNRVTFLHFCHSHDISYMLLLNYFVGVSRDHQIFGVWVV